MTEPSAEIGSVVVPTATVDDVASVDFGSRPVGPVAEVAMPSPTSPKAISLDELAGVDEIKVELRDQVRLWADPEPLRRLGGVPRIGFIFAGPTGTGKTTAAHALAAETGRDLYTFAGPDFAGDAGRELLTTVLTVMSRRPAVVFIDEADDLLHTRDFRRERSESLVKHLLVGLDRTTRDIRSFFVLATNLEPDAIDAALCHPGRLGRPILFRSLAARERLALLEKQARDFRMAADVELGTIAAQLGGMPTATLVHVLDEGAFIAASRGHASIEPGDLQEGVSRLRGGLARMRPWEPDELRRTALHEAGHAIVSIVLAGRWDAVSWVEVNARADGGLGETFGGELDLALLTEPELRHRLAAAIAGRVAEIVVTGAPDVGAASDLRATNALALRAAREWGLSSRGPVLSDEYADAIVEADVDAAVRGLLERAEADAAAILDAHRSALDDLTERLVLHRAGSGADVARWLSDHALVAPAEEGAR
jgi:cell division protease FtsH